MLFFDLFRHDPKLIDLKQGAYLFQEGDPGDLMYVLVEGEATVKIGNQVLEHVGPGDILGEMGVVDHSPRSATVCTTTNCKFAVIDEKRFHFLVDESPQFAIEVMRVMARRLRQSDIALANVLGNNLILTGRFQKTGVREHE
jgi:CRP/FNR family cyclic AMP-dependent transcriptional regulator